jgi:hypothetical protein
MIEVGDRVRIDSERSPYNRNLGRVTKVIKVNTDHPSRTIQVTLDAGEGQSIVNWYNPMNLELIEKCKVDTTEPEDVSLQQYTFREYSRTYEYVLVDTHTMQFVSFEDGHWTFTKNIVRAIKSGSLFPSRESAERSWGAITDTKTVQVYKIDSFEMKATPVVPYTKDEIIAKMKAKGVTDNELRILMGDMSED